MRILDLKVGYSCNNNCLHCVIKDNLLNCIKNDISPDKTFEKCLNEIDDAYINGARILILTGGEPTIRKDILDLVIYAKKKGFKISMQTNGRAFFYLNFAKKFVNLIDTYVIAVHGSNSKTHDLITQKKGSFNQTLNGLKNLILLNQNVVIKVVISKINYKELKDLVMVVNKLTNATNFTVAFPHGQGNAWTYKDKVIPSYEEINSSVCAMLDFVRNSSKIKLDLETFPFCTIENYPDFFAKSSKKPNEKSLVNVDDTVPKDWNLLRVTIKSKFKFCKDCIYDSNCEGPWNDYVKIYGECGFKPIKK